MHNSSAVPTAGQTTNMHFLKSSVGFDGSSSETPAFYKKQHKRRNIFWLEDRDMRFILFLFRVQSSDLGVFSLIVLSLRVCGDRPAEQVQEGRRRVPPSCCLSSELIPPSCFSPSPKPSSCQSGAAMPRVVAAILDQVDSAHDAVTLS